MRTGQSEVARQLGTLFASGSVAGIRDHELLERFLFRRDEVGEAAFTALVVRYGPMVLKVCRGIVKNSADAEDAFQATFLLLATSAGRINNPELLGNWLYGVALRTAMKARSRDARRQRHEQAAADRSRPPSTPPEDDADAEFCAALHHAINELPPKYRAPVVLCHLQGLSRQRTADMLGCPVSTVGVRLMRARERLRTALLRHRHSFTASVIATSLDRAADAATVPTALVESTTATAVLLSLGSGKPLTATSASVVRLLKEAQMSLLLSKLRFVVAVLVACGVVTSGLTILAMRPGATGKTLNLEKQFFGFGHAREVEIAHGDPPTTDHRMATNLLGTEPSASTRTVAANHEIAKPGPERIESLDQTKAEVRVDAALGEAPAQPPASAATVSGQVVDSKDQPVPGVEVMLSGWGDGMLNNAVRARTTSVRDGRFRIGVPAEKDPDRQDSPVAVWAYDAKLGVAGQMIKPSKMPAAGSMKLKLAGPVQATVRVLGPDAKPVAGARVTPVWLRVIDGMAPRSSFLLPDSLGASLAATTDAQGTARIQGSRAEDVDTLMVQAAGLGSQATELGAAAGGIATVTLRAAGRVTGRVQIADRSLAGGLLIYAITLPEDRKDSQTTGEARTTTDADGRFEIPAIAAGKLAINALPAATTKLRAKPPAGLSIKPGTTIELTIAIDTPPRERTLRGRVIDSSGQPIAAAKVFQSGDSPARTEAETGPDGRFQLAGVIARPTFVFARKPGYRFSARAVAADSDDVSVSLRKVDQPPALIRKALPDPLPHQDELALARRLLDPYVERALKAGREPEKVRTLEALAGIAPERCLDLIQKKAFNNDFLSGMIGQRVVMRMMDENVDDALTVLESLEDPTAKAMGYVEASIRLGAAKRAQALEVLDRALLNARAARGPDGIKLAMLARVAEGFLDLGQNDRATALLREGQAVAKQLPTAGWASYARGTFAEELAQIDPDAALELTKDLTNENGFDRHHGNIAHELAGRNPALAERVLAMVKEQSQRDDSAVRVVYRMAPLDLPRARRLAESIGDPCLKGFGLGMMALRLAETGKDSARKLLDSAYEVLERTAAAGKPSTRSLYFPAPVAGNLLDVAERIDSNIVDEYLDRALTLRPPVLWENNPSGDAAYIDVQLAMMLARYDRSLARSLVEPIASGKGSAPPERLAVGVLYAAAAAIDPKWAVELVEALPNDSDLETRSSKNAARLAVANVLGRTGQRRIRHLQHSYLYLWIPDTEDINPDD
jgi:RNA polymerase sigma factor (sigma-70 family)